MLEDLLRLGCRGIFTTHLHEIFDLPLELGNVEFVHMEIAPSEKINSWVPTWRLAPLAPREVCEAFSY